MHIHAPSGAATPLSAASRGRIAKILAAIVVPMALATIIGLIVLWPRGETPVGSIPLNDEKSSLVRGKITSVGTTDELGQTEVQMNVDGISVPVHVPAEVVASGLSVGDTIQARFTPSMLESGVAYVFVDFERGPAMLALLAVYIAVVLLVAGRKGFMSLLGLGASLLVVGLFMIPALASGTSALPVVLAGGGAMMFLSIYLAHGVSIRTTTAILGTAFGLVITAGVATWAVDAQNLTGATGDEGAMLSWNLGGMNMRSLLLCGIVLAGLGALNDVTITQVSTIWELHAESPHSSRRRLFMRGMAIGRDHIASTVYTLAFAYVGSALPLLILASLYDRPFLDLLQVAQISEEIARTLAASIGLVLAIPATTAIAAMLAPVAPSREKKNLD